MKIRCNHCMAVFDEEDIVIDPTAETASEMEHCPVCGRTGALMDLEADE